MNNNGTAQEITPEQASQAIETLRAYFRQERQKEMEAGGEDLSAMLLVMIARQQRAIALEGKPSNIMAMLAVSTQVDPDLGVIFEKAARFAADGSPEAAVLKAEARKVFGVEG